jgi:hypothetical protein
MNLYLIFINIILFRKIIEIFFNIIIFKFYYNLNIITIKSNHHLKYFKYFQVITCYYHILLLILLFILIYPVHMIVKFNFTN